MVEGEIRCEFCCKTYWRRQDLKTHLTVGCDLSAACRVGTLAEEWAHKDRQMKALEHEEVVTLGAEKLENVFEFAYLGYTSQEDGDC